MKSIKYITNIFSSYLWALLFLLLITACQKQRDQPQDSTDQPNVTNDEHEPILITDNGDTVLTGVPLPIIGLRIDSDQLILPQSSPFKGSPTVIPANNNVRVASEPQKGIILSDPEIITLGMNGIPLPESTLAKGEKIIAGQPQPVTALAPIMKENATGNLQYWGIDQGMNSANAKKIIEDGFGNLWILCPPSGISRFDGQNFTHYTTSEGLHFNSSRNMFLDSKGTLWIGGWQGLSSFDGTNFTRYLSSNGLKGTSVLSIMEDNNRLLWFSTHGGVTRYDGEHFTQFIFDQEKWLNFNSMIQDTQGHLWFGSANDGVYHFDPEQKDAEMKIVHYTEDQGLSNNRITSIIEDNEGLIWIGTKDGLNKWDGKEFVNYSTDQGLVDNRINSIMEDSQGKLWFGTDEGANQFDGRNLLKITTEDGLSDNVVNDILEDNNGNIWLGTKKGLHRYRNNSFRYISEEKFLNRMITDIQESKEGDLWFGLSQGGLSRYKENKFLNFGEKELGVLTTTHAVLEDRKGRLWIGGSRGLSVIEDNIIKKYWYSSGLPNNYIRCLHEDAQGTIWIGGNDGVSSFASPKDISSSSDLIDQKFEVTRYTEDHGMTGWVVNSIMEDSKGNIWFAMDVGVTKYERNDDRQTGTFTHFTKNEGFSSELVYSMMAGEQGEVWFATSGEGVFRFDPEGNDRERFTQYSTSQGLSHNIATSLVQDDQGNIWVGTIRGLNVLKPVSKINNSASSIPTDDYQCITFQKSDGLKYLSFSPDVTLDSKKRIWWGTGDAVTMLDLKLFESATDPPRVRLNHINIKEEYVDFRRLNEADYRRTISFGNDLQNAVSNAVPFYNYPHNLELPFHLNHLTFFFSGIDWAAPHRIKYSYMIEGLDNDWSIPSHEGKADYRNIPSGNFTFKLKAIGAAQKWSDTFEYSFRVSPPWWLSFWAYSFYFLLFCGGVFIVYQLQKSRIERKERAKNQLRELEQAKEIEKAYTELKSTQSQLIQSEKMASLGELTAGIAHEIQNPLNFVNNFSDVNIELIDELVTEITTTPLSDQNIEDAVELAEDIKSNEAKIKHHGSRADSIVKGMLQHSRTSSGEKVPTDINVLCDEYLRLAYHGLRAKDNSFNATYETEFDNTLPQVNVIPQDISRVLLNLLNNAFQTVAERAKNTETGYQPTVKITTQIHDGKIEIIVNDNGNGIPENIIDKIFQPFFTTKPTGQGTGLGLSLAFDIVTKGHEGELKVQSKMGIGSKFIIKLPM